MTGAEADQPCDGGMQGIGADIAGQLMQQGMVGLLGSVLGAGRRRRK